MSSVTGNVFRNKEAFKVENRSVKRYINMRHLEALSVHDGWA